MQKRQLITKIFTVTILLFSVMSLTSENTKASSSSIIVTFPSYEDTLYNEEGYYIRWSSQNTSNYVDIELYKNGRLKYVIAYSAQDDGSFYWYIPDSFSGSGYSIKIIDSNNKSCYGFSGLFSISYQYISITSPTSSDVWYKGETYSIKWDAQLQSSKVEIQLLYNTGTYISIDDDVQNSGSYKWKVYKYLSPGYYNLKIVSKSNGNYYDITSSFRIDEYPIDVISPANDSNFRSGEVYPIKWTGGVTDGNVTIMLYKGEKYYKYIDSTKNDGIYNWVVPESCPTGDDYKIKIESPYYVENYDYSSYFSITRQFITVVTPYTNNTWYKNKSYRIYWNHENAGNFVNIKLYRNNTFLYTITSNTTNNGKYQWDIPNNLTSDSTYQIKITSLLNNNIYGFSRSFIIDDQYIIIQSPRYNDTWYRGLAYNISWTSKNIGENVSIELCRLSPKQGNNIPISKKIFCYTTSITQSTNNDGVFTWKIPKDIPTDYIYKIKITELRSPKIISINEILYNYSHEFYIKDPITITCFNNHKKLLKGKTFEITWESPNIVGDYVRIDLYRDNNFFITISKNTSNSGTYSWLVPDDIPSGSDYRIKITSTADGKIYALSEEYFTIDEAFNILLIIAATVIIITVVVLIWLSKKKLLLQKNRSKKVKKQNQEGKIQLIEKEVDSISASPDIKNKIINPEEYEEIWENKNF